MGVDDSVVPVFRITIGTTRGCVCRLNDPGASRSGEIGMAPVCYDASRTVAEAGDPPGWTAHGSRLPGPRDVFAARTLRSATVEFDATTHPALRTHSLPTVAPPRTELLILDPEPTDAPCHTIVEAISTPSPICASDPTTTGPASFTPEPMRQSLPTEAGGIIWRSSGRLSELSAHIPGWISFPAG